MKEYNVSFMVSYSNRVLAESPKEAVDIVVRNCIYDGIDDIFVVDTETGEEFKIFLKNY